MKTKSMTCLIRVGYTHAIHDYFAVCNALSGVTARSIFRTGSSLNGAAQVRGAPAADVPPIAIPLSEPAVHIN